MLDLLLAAALAHGSGPVEIVLPEAAASANRPLTPQEQMLRTAQELRYAQRWFESAAVYRQFLATFPTSDRVPTARFYLATVLERDQRWDEAAAGYTDFLDRHPDQRSLGKEARLGRIRCWGIRQNQAPAATPGLVAALQDSEPEVRIQAGLELSRTMDKRAIPVLNEGLGVGSFADRCTMALISLGQKPAPPAQKDQSRFLVVRILEKGKQNPVEIRLSVFFVRALGNYLSDEQLKQVRKQGLDVENLGDQLQKLPKGSTLFSVTDKTSSVTVTVE